MKIAVIGSNRGIGLEFVRQLNADHQVYAFCRDSSEGLEALAPQKIIRGFDVTQENSIKDGLAELEDEKLDWLLHVSGILRSTSLEDLNPQAITEQFQVNALAPLLTTKSFLPYLKEGSKIGWLTSRMGSVADNSSGGSYGYRMSKTAMNMAGVSMAHDLKDQGVSLFLLHPGYVKTDMTGNTGHIDPKTSVEGLLKIMNQKNQKDTGTFWHTNGEPLPW